MMPGSDALQQTQDQDSLRSLHEAFSMIPHNEKEAYLEALTRAPNLVEKESSPLWFLKFDKHNPWAASKRLAMYWKQRKEVFGSERAFLPIDATGEGALSKEAIELISTGYLAHLPQDREGRSSLVHDSSKRISCETKHRMEILYYLFALLMENPASVGKGFHLIVLVRGITFDGDWGALGRAAIVFPLIMYKAHFVIMENATSFMDRVAPFFLRLFGHITKRDNFIVYNTNSKAELVKKLTDEGFNMEGIPDVIGGNWSYEQHELWLEHRLRIEWNLPLFGAARKMYANHYAKKISEMTEEEKAERRRRYNVLNSRRKRRRDRIENDSLLSQTAQLQQANDQIKQDNERLAGLLEKCYSILRLPQPIEYYNTSTACAINNNAPVTAEARQQQPETAQDYCDCDAPPPPTSVTNKDKNACETGQRRQKRHKSAEPYPRDRKKTYLQVVNRDVFGPDSLSLNQPNTKDCSIQVVPRPQNESTASSRQQFEIRNAVSGLQQQDNQYPLGFQPQRGVYNNQYHGQIHSQLPLETTSLQIDCGGGGGGGFFMPLQSNIGGGLQNYHGGLSPRLPAAAAALAATIPSGTMGLPTRHHHHHPAIPTTRTSLMQQQAATSTTKNNLNELLVLQQLSRAQESPESLLQAMEVSRLIGMTQVPQFSSSSMFDPSVPALVPPPMGGTFALPITHDNSNNNNNASHFPLSPGPNSLPHRLDFISQAQETSQFQLLLQLWREASKPHMDSTNFKGDSMRK